ncbi:MAG: hypothetical protein IJN88_07740 [Clostridia bacterium]|nr:hypothetical protein [Clostridia bacterium]
MNKKLFAVIAVIVIAVTAVCLIVFTGKDEAETTVPADGQPVTVDFDSFTTEKSKENLSYDTEITVTLPIDFIDEEYRDNLDAFAEAKGYFSIKKKGDDKVKIRMREYSYRLLLTSIGIETVGSIGYAMDSGDYSFVDKFAEYNSDFSDVVFTVNKTKYEEAENKDEFFSTVAFCCLYYQDYSKDSKGKCKITLCEKGTNKVIETRELDRKDLK